MKASTAVGWVAAASVAVATAEKSLQSLSSALAAFAHSSASPIPSRPPKSRWNIVTPIPEKRKAIDSEMSVQSPETRKRKKTNGKTSSSTSSFGPLTADNFPNSENKDIKIHTLILGTHPSVKSFEEDQYYAHKQNAFWWIAGDCLGFRRDKAVSETTGKPFALASALRYEKIISYEEQTELLCSNGFALWDIVQSCKRPGSLDSNIKDDIPNDIVGFCQHHPSIRRIVFANGKSGCDFFTKHFEEWLKIGPFVPAEDEVSKKLLGKWVGSSAMASSKPQIECVVALAVSPAAATYKYSEKRDFWEKHVYQPGLEDHDRLNAQQHS